MALPSFKRFSWWFWVYVIRTGGLPSLLAPFKAPPGEGMKLKSAAARTDTLIIFNPGGWGDVSLEDAEDFRPILEGIRETVRSTGRRCEMVPFLRTLTGPWGRLAGMKDQILGFRYSSRVQVKVLEELAHAFPDRRLILVGFSTGGGLTARSLRNLGHLPNLIGITVGVPGWFRTFTSPKSLVLDNLGRDPLVSGDIYSVTYHVFSVPYVWLSAHLKGQKLSLPLAFRFPHHEYTWNSEEVGPPIVRFVKGHLG